jgi:cell wall-associated NlpC family hydrolase
MRGSRDFRGLAWLIAVLTTGCASTGFVPRPFPTPAGSATVAPATPVDPPSPAPAASDSYALVGTALDLRGTPYRNGGSDPSGFDCSGFTQYVFAQHGIALPRAVEEQFQVGTGVKPGDLASGDLVFFSTVSRGASHVGIAIGGDEFIHAPSSTGVVRVEHLSSSYWSQRFLAAKRLNGLAP